MNEATARSMVVQATMPMALLAADGALLGASSPWERLLGTAPTLSALVAEADDESVRNVLSKGREGTFDVRLRADDSKWVKLQATRLADESALLVVATDVTTVHAELADLQDRIGFMEWQALSLSTFAKVIGSARVILFAMDQSGVTTMSDGKGLELLGLTPGERVGRNELAATVGRPENEYLRRALAGETLRVLVEPVEGVHLDTWYMPQKDENDQPAGVLGLSIDATDRVLSEKRLAEKIEIVEQQTVTIRDLAAPVIKVWQEVVCMPIIGAVDAPRATDMMERLLESIVREKARFAILDLTGVELMDTSTVDHMLRIFAAARTVGVEGVLSGVRPRVAQSVISLGVDISGLRMMRTLHDALAWCLEKREADANRRALSPRGLSLSRA
ncbi:MAG: STAS domain-containing protein [Polyangiaceae bacterium]